MQYRSFAVLIMAVLGLWASDVFAAVKCKDGILCYESVTYPVLSTAFTATGGVAYTVATNDLKQISGQSTTPDTILVVVNPSTGAVLATNDDSGGYRSQVTVTSASTATLYVFVSSYSSGGHGTTDLTVTHSGGTVVSLNDQLFGGMRLSSVSVKSGDRMYLGVPPDGGDHTYSDNVMYLFSSSSLNCTSSCGTYQAASALPLSIIRSSSITSNSAMVLAGSWYSDTPVATRWMHYRNASGWGGGQAHQDSESGGGDGLTWELEALNDGTDASLSINTCDTTTGPSSDCSTTVGRKFTARASWSASDSDNDGLKDLWEVFGGVVECAATPVAPFYKAGTCNDVTIAGSSGGWSPQIPLSALDADPRTTDAFFQFDYQTGVAPSSNVLSRIRHMFEEEGLECEETTSTNAANCTASLSNYNRVNLHLYLKEISPNLYEDTRDYWVGFDYFNVGLASFRKHTKVFRYAQATVAGNTGVTTLNGRVMTVLGNPSSNVNGTSEDWYAAIVVHETGHQLGLSHGGSDGLEAKPNYPSVMSYYPYAGLAKKMDPTVDNDMWPDDSGTNCSGNPSVCNQGGDCWSVTNKCAPVCGAAHFRFSRGSNPSLDEDALTEGSKSEKFATELWCAGNTPFGGGWKSKTAVTNPPTCTTGSPCAVSWNGNSNYAESGATDNTDFTGDADFNDVVSDSDDWRRMYDYTKMAGNDHEPIFRVYSSDFNHATSPTSFGAYSHTHTISGTLTKVAGGIGSGDALSFGGPCSGGCTTPGVALTSNAAIRTMGTTVDGVAPQGFRVDTYAKFTNFSTGTGHQLVHSDLVELDVANSSKKARAIIKTSGVSSASLTSSKTLTTNTWYWITIVWNKTQARLYVREWTGSGWSGNTSASACDRSTITYGADVDPGAVTFGRYPPSPTTWALTGVLDQPRLFNYPGCFFSNDIDTIDCNGATSGGLECGQTTIP